MELLMFFLMPAVILAAAILALKLYSGTSLSFFSLLDLFFEWLIDLGVDHWVGLAKAFFWLATVQVAMLVWLINGELGVTGKVDSSIVALEMSVGENLEVADVLGLNCFEVFKNKPDAIEHCQFVEQATSTPNSYINVTIDLLTQVYYFSLLVLIILGLALSGVTARLFTKRIRQHEQTSNRRPRALRYRPRIRPRRWP